MPIAAAPIQTTATAPMLRSVGAPALFSVGAPAGRRRFTNPPNALPAVSQAANDMRSAIPINAMIAPTGPVKRVPANAGILTAASAARTTCRPMLLVPCTAPAAIADDPPRLLSKFAVGPEPVNAGAGAGAVVVGVPFPVPFPWPCLPVPVPVPPPPWCCFPLHAPVIADAPTFAIAACAWVSSAGGSFCIPPGSCC